MNERRPITLEALEAILALAMHERQPTGWVVVLLSDRHQEAVGPYEDPREAADLRDRLTEELSGTDTEVIAMPLYAPDDADADERVVCLYRPSNPEVVSLMDHLGICPGPHHAIGREV